MKVLILLFADYPGHSAGANHAQRLALALRTAGVEAMVLGYCPEGHVGAGPGRDARGVAYECFDLGAGSCLVPPYVSLVSRYCRAALPAFERLLAAGGWVAVIYNGRSWVLGRALASATRRHGVPLVPYQMEWFGLTPHRVLNGSLVDQVLFRRHVLPRAAGVIGISSFWSSWAGRHGLPSVVIPAIADDHALAAPSPPPRGAGEPFRVVFVGGWGPRELPLTLIEGLGRAVDRGADLRLVVVGNVGARREERPALRTLDRHPGLKARTEFTGWVTDDAMARHLASAHAFVLLRADDRETAALFPTRLPEYLASGNPVIVSSAGDLGLYLRHRESAWLIPPGHAPEALAEAVLHLADHEDERRAIGLGGRQVAREAFGFAPLGERLRDFLVTLPAPVAQAAGAAHDNRVAGATTETSGHG